MEGPVPFLAALGLIAVLELGDKTQLATISLASRHPWLPVLAGASAGLVLVTAIGAAIGTVLADLLAPWILGIQVGGGAAFIALGVVGLLRRSKEVEVPESALRGAFAQAFAMNALAEMGDKTQLAVIILSATTAAPVSVFLGASVGLTAVAASSVIVGTALSKVLRAETIRIVAATLFIAAGVLLILEAAVSG